MNVTFQTAPQESKHNWGNSQRTKEYPYKAIEARHNVYMKSRQESQAANAVQMSLSTDSHSQRNMIWKWCQLMNECKPIAVENKTQRQIGQ
jgi:hypothetical protein